jgi:hypothetical protein
MPVLREKNTFWDISTKPKIRILWKWVSIEANTKLHAHKKIHEFLINMAFTMAYPNFKKGLKMTIDPLGVNSCQSLKRNGVILLFLLLQPRPYIHLMHLDHVCH